MLGVLPFEEDPDLSVSAARALAQHLPPCIGPKNKVVGNPIYGYQNLSGEKYKRNGKRISSIRHTSEEKNPKNHPQMQIS